MFPEYNYNMFNQCCGMNNYNNSNCSTTDSNDEIITLNQAINLINKSIQAEREDEVFYDNLIRQASTEREKQIITAIRDDENKHNQLLRKIYFEITGQVIPTGMTMEYQQVQGEYKNNMQKALFDELEDVKRYRKIMSVMPSGELYTLLMSIMTDEIIHANKCNFLLNILK